MHFLYFEIFMLNIWTTIIDIALTRRKIGKPSMKLPVGGTFSQKDKEWLLIILIQDTSAQHHNSHSQCTAHIRYRWCSPAPTPTSATTTTPARAGTRPGCSTTASGTARRSRSTPWWALIGRELVTWPRNRLWLVQVGGDQYNVLDCGVDCLLWVKTKHR